MANWVIVGAGYTGQRLARRLCHEGDAVVVTRRDPEEAERVAAGVLKHWSAGAGSRGFGDVRGVGLDIDRLSAGVSCIGTGDIVVDSVPPRGMMEGEKALVRLCAERGAARLIYLSSTGVYPAGGGECVDETTPPRPLSQRGRLRFEAETALTESAAAVDLDAVVLRIAAIYGPGRGPHMRMLAGTYRLVGAANTAVSRIHVDDLVEAIVTVGRLDALPHRIVNIADDDPAPSREVAEGLVDLLGVSPPVTVESSAVSADVRAMLTADRVVGNARLKELGVRLRYPSWRDGVPASLSSGSEPT